MSTSQRRAYISGALTGAPALDVARRRYEEAADTCSAHGYDAFVPHLQNDPELAPQLSPEVVYTSDHGALESADLVVAFLGTPSLGVGAEVAIALQHKSRLVAIYAQPERVSRFMLGLIRAHGGHELRLTSYDDLSPALDRWLKESDNHPTSRTDH